VACWQSPHAYYIRPELKEAWGAGSPRLRLGLVGDTDISIVDSQLCSDRATFEKGFGAWRRECNKPLYCATRYQQCELVGLAMV